MPICFIKNKRTELTKVVEADNPEKVVDILQATTSDPLELIGIDMLDDVSLEKYHEEICSHENGFTDSGEDLVDCCGYKDLNPTNRCPANIYEHWDGSVEAVVSPKKKDYEVQVILRKNGGIDITIFGGIISELKQENAKPDSAISTLSIKTQGWRIQPKKKDSRK